LRADLAPDGVVVGAARIRLDDPFDAWVDHVEAVHGLGDGFESARFGLFEVRRRQPTQRVKLCAHRRVHLRQVLLKPCLQNLVHLLTRAGCDRSSVGFADAGFQGVGVEVF
jgi:hypothetical protein